MKTRLRYFLLLAVSFLSAFSSAHAAFDPNIVQKLPIDEGWSVSVSGDTAIIGDYGDDDKAINSGAAYIFVRSGDLWTQEAKLTADDVAAWNFFGYSVFVSGDTAVIGANSDLNNNYPGSAYVFVRSEEGSWIQQAKLTADDETEGDIFGYSVFVSGNTAVIGATGCNNESGISSGAAYIFVRSDNLWTQEAKLIADDGGLYDKFGWSVSFHDDTAIIGTPFKDDDEDSLGSAYVFVRSDKSWTQEAKLTANDGTASFNFGRSVSLSDNTAVIGADGDNDEDMYSGSAYVFIRSSGSWTQEAKLTADDAAAWDYFGWNVSVSGDTAIIGAKGDGSAYVFTREDDVWNQQQKLVAFDSEGSIFGNSVYLSGDTAAIGASDATYIFYNTSTIPKEAEITHTISPPSNTSVEQDEWLQFNITHTNNSDNEVKYTAQAYLVLPDETVKNGKDQSLLLKPQQTKNIDSYLRIPANALTGAYSLGTTITYTESGEIDDDSFNFTVSSSESSLHKRANDKNSSFILKQVERK